MADADQGQRLKIIADELEATYQAMRKAAANISGLLQVGRATCTDVKAYNLWALALYNTQRGMLAALRAGGEKGVPDLPPQPTTFPWRGVDGANAYQIDCGSTATTLRGLMDTALKGPQEGDVYLSTNDVSISTQDLYAYNPNAAPSFAQLYQERIQPQLGAFPLIPIIIAGVIAISVSVAISAIMRYFEVQKIQEENTKQVRIQAEAFATMTAARLSCYQQCLNTGGSVAVCTSQCAKLITKPDIKLPTTPDGKWGVLQLVGFATLATFGTWAAYKLYKRKQATGRFLPV